MSGSDPHHGPTAVQPTRTGQRCRPYVPIWAATVPALRDPPGRGSSAEDGLTRGHRAFLRLHATMVEKQAIEGGSTMLLVAKILAIVAAASVSGAVAVPLGIFTNVNPILVFCIAAMTATCVAWGLVLGGQRLRSWLTARDDRDSKALTRTQQVVDRFGPVGLGLIGPVFPGVVASSLSGIALGVDSKRLGIWLTIGIGLWFSLFTVAWWGIRQGVFR